MTGVAAASTNVVLVLDNLVEVQGPGRVSLRAQTSTVQVGSVHADSQRAEECT